MQYDFLAGDACIHFFPRNECPGGEITVSALRAVCPGYPAKVRSLLRIVFGVEAEAYALARTDRVASVGLHVGIKGEYPTVGFCQAFGAVIHKVRIDILRARRATGLMRRNGYKVVTDITIGKYSVVRQ